MQLIQIAGIGRAGKTTLSKLIAKYLFTLGYIPVIVPFAGELKDMAASLGYSKETNPDKYREFCQAFGADMRKENIDYWVYKTANTLKKYLIKEDATYINKDPRKYVIIQDDVRYMNELAFGMGVNSYRIFLSPGARPIPEEDAEWRFHESELLNNTLNEGLMSSFYGIKNTIKDVTLSELFNVVVLNDKTEEYLEAKVEKHCTNWLRETKDVDITGLKGILNDSTK